MSGGGRSKPMSAGRRWSRPPIAAHRRSGRGAVGGAAVANPARSPPTGSDRILEAVYAAFDPAGRHDVVVNVQGDLPTIEREGGARPAGAAGRRRRSISRRWRRRDHARRRKRDDPNVVKAVVAFTEVGLPAVGCARSISRARRRPPAKARSIITLASTPIGGQRSRASSRSRPRRWNAARNSNNCARSKRACGSTLRWSTSRRSASTRPRICAAPARSSPRP